MSVDGEARGLGWPAVVGLGAAHFCLFADRAIPSAFAPALRADFGLTDAQIGLLIGPAMILPFAVATIVAANWLGRVSAWTIITISMLAWSLASATGALAATFAGMVAGRIAFGIAQAGFAPAAASLLSRSIKPPAPLAISAFTTGSASGRSGGLLLGGALLLAVGGLALPVAPWRIASLALLIPNILLALMLWRLSRRAIEAHVPAPGLGSGLRWIGSVRTTFLGHMIASAGILMIAQAIGAWAPSILNREFGLTTAGSAMLAGAAVLIGVPIGHLAAGRLASRAHFLRSGPAPLMIGGSLIAFVGCIALHAATSLAGATIALVVMIAGGGVAAATSLIGLQLMVPPRERLSVNALFLAVTTAFGYAIGPWLTGWLSDAIEHDGHALAFALLLLVAGAAALVFVAAISASAGWRRLAADNA
ncbi:MFS transporter [Sphingomonas crocodyli]|nr:MFS transporter [Sphingomonas crocodyli]